MEEGDCLAVLVAGEAGGGGVEGGGIERTAPVWSRCGDGGGGGVGIVTAWN